MRLPGGWSFRRGCETLAEPGQGKSFPGETVKFVSRPGVGDRHRDRYLRAGLRDPATISLFRFPGQPEVDSLDEQRNNTLTLESQFTPCR